MGRYTGTPPVTPSITQTQPIGAVVSMLRSGTDYKMMGDIIQRSLYPALSSAFPRNGQLASVASTLTNQQWLGCAYGNGIWLMTGLASGGGASAFCAISRDGGKTWRAGDMPTSKSWSGVVFLGGLFYVSCYSGEVYSSPDAVTWTALTTVPASYGAQYFKYVGSLFFAMCGSGSTIYTSPDCVTWTIRTLSFSGSHVDVAYGAGKYFITNVNATLNGTSSPDGITWTTRTMPNGAYYSIAFGAGVFVAMSYSTSSFATSTDGITWVQRVMPAAAGAGQRIVFGDGLFMTTSTLANRCGVSYDGINFIEKATALGVVQDPAQPIAYGAGMFVTGKATTGQVTYAENLTDSDYMYLSGTAGQSVRVK